MKPCPQGAPNAAGFVLAGGRSSRMGQDKALIELGGQTLAARAVELLRTTGLSATFAGARSHLAEFAPVIPDTAPEVGPLGGICSALASMERESSKAESGEAEFGVFIPVDLPLLPASLLRYLLADARITGSAVTLTSVDGFAQTFPAVIERSLLADLRMELAAGRSGCFAAFQAAAARRGQRVRVVPAEMLAQTGQVADPRGLPPFQWFLNVNTPAELERVRLAIA